MLVDFEDGVIADVTRGLKYPIPTRFNLSSHIFSSSVKLLSLGKNV